MATIVKIGRGKNTKNRFSVNFRGKSQIWVRGEIGNFIKQGFFNFELYFKHLCSIKDRCTRK